VTGQDDDLDPSFTDLRDERTGETLDREDVQLVTDGGRDQDREPLREVATGTCWYYEGDPGEEHQVRHKGLSRSPRTGSTARAGPAGSGSPASASWGCWSSTLTWALRR
jgi:hypothetical protein